MMTQARCYKLPHELCPRVLTAMVLLGLPRTWNLMGLVNKATLVAQPSKDLHAVPLQTVTPSACDV